MIEIEWDLVSLLSNPLFILGSLVSSLAVSFLSDKRNQELGKAGTFFSNFTYPLSQKPQLAENHDVKDGVLKQSFSPEKVPDDLDAIIIGSGIGGLTTAALLAKAGKRVLVLEQHDQAGGCCHTFVDKGFEFDVGVHYLGAVGCQTPNETKLLMDFISDGNIQFVPMDEYYDEVRLRYMDSDSSKKARSITMQSSQQSGKEAFIQNLIRQFPTEEIVIKKFVDMVEKAVKAMEAMFVVKLLPLWLSKLLVKLGVIQWWYNTHFWMDTSLMEIIENLTSNPDLQAAFLYCCGDFGCPPSEANFGMVAEIHHHYWTGSFYPMGGPSEIAYRIIPVIEKSGGRVLVRASVKKINTEDGKVVGVSISKGSHSYNINCDTVISDAGLFNTFEKFLSPTIAKGVPLGHLQRTFESSPAGFQEKGELESQLDSDVALMFVSFPSAKDPDYNRRFPGKSCAVIVTFFNYDWFAKWKDTRYSKRGDDYEGVKKTLGHKLVEQLCVLFPQLEGKLEYSNFGSALTHNHYLGVEKGEAYGLRHDRFRFSLDNQAILRPETGIPGLYMTGQDICTAGVAGAMFGGLLSAASVLKMDLVTDLMKWSKELANKQQTLKKTQ
ncbi:unnamed protein product [Cyprideis torosa]|uniref:Uncharacterized protein n=1 Tax=Cyprideis torosa TaxID=163714 RepID=A0A7R8ZK86_9CRUS|nr:unnamed protein product [Cyprideis torosa]CAG0888764.1 unnamed protein product [Cyprideis torosa]